ncbi:MAG: hypothetical protein NC489_33810 [Ruminococcus flavefaciens]|nr:hypothetical protein [Ruminococcus flavefaciens]
MKVIIYGVKNIETRRNIEYFLDDNYEIVGYSDGHYPYDVLDGKKFFFPEELPNQEYDFIVLTAQSSSTQTEISKVLSALGVPPEKIIRPFIFKQGNAIKIHADLIDNIKRYYKGEPNLIFGLSYSCFGINEKELAATFFNVSYPSLDIYYNFSLYNYLREHKLFTNLGIALFVMPYYYFDFDLSMTISGYESGAMFTVHQLDDWHNYQRVSGAVEYVVNYHMFGKKIAQFYHVPMWKDRGYRVMGDPEGSCMLNSIWFKDHKETVEENRELFTRFYQKMVAGGGAPIVVIPPYYIQGLSKLSKAAVQVKKEKFYRILKELEKKLGAIKIYDYFDALPDRRELFGDVRHLNAHGAEEFTKLINRDILG